MYYIVMHNNVVHITMREGRLVITNVNKRLAEQIVSAI